LQQIQNLKDTKDTKMPQITKYRKWCKSCNEYEIHWYKWDSENGNSKYICEKCDTEFSDINLTEIPAEKLKEQRERYKQNEADYINNLFASRLFRPNATMFSRFFDSTDEIGIKIDEDDAGQIAIQTENRKIANEKEKIEHENYQALAVEYQKFKRLNRNDKCGCGSNKKYKKCCLGKWANFHEKSY